VAVGIDTEKPNHVFAVPANSPRLPLLSPEHQIDPRRRGVTKCRFCLRGRTDQSQSVEQPFRFLPRKSSVPPRLRGDIDSLPCLGGHLRYGDRLTQQDWVPLKAKHKFMKPKNILLRCTSGVHRPAVGSRGPFGLPQPSR
jgi:hypothetical protein